MFHNTKDDDSCCYFTNTEFITGVFAETFK